MIKFTKMHGLGNDFAVFNGVQQAINFTPEQITFIADRHIGIGADQVIIVKPPLTNDYDFQYIIYNQDGSEVGQCGNAARCLGVFLDHKNLTKKNKNTVRTTTTQLDIELKNSGDVVVNMGEPKFSPKDIPLLVDELKSNESGQYQYQFNDKEVKFSALSIGNPHAVIVVDNVEAAGVETLGPIMEAHAIFPEKVNVGFMEIVNKREIKLRVFERGVGETNACGSGACAAMVAGVELGLLDNNINASLIGGNVHLSWQGRGHSVFMTGSATTVFEGEIDLPLNL